MNGRIILSKTEGVSRLLYPAISLEVTNNIIKEVDKNLFNFIWRNRSHYIKKCILTNSVCNGGLNVLDFSTSNTTLKNRWINYFQYKNQIWYLIPNLIFEKNGWACFSVAMQFWT